MENGDFGLAKQKKIIPGGRQYELFRKFSKKKKKRKQGAPKERKLILKKRGKKIYDLVWKY